MKLPTLLELLQAGVHFGHQKGRWHPKMKDFIFTERGGVHIIDLEKTVEKLQIAIDFVKETAQRGGVILFVGTKRQGQKIIEKYALACGMPYISERWIGGLFTNFSNVNKLIKKYKELTEKKESGALEKYTKKEQVEFHKEIEKLKKLVGGLAELKKIPEAIFVLDVKKEKTAVAEARKRKIPIVAFCDTNINPDLIDYSIPANDDAVKSIEIITSIISETIKEGKTKQEKTSIV
ncbi:30S ribosomal protein S2 [Candidatus Falkowbacteria bacterium]|nr:30S ribosomal protein S2 [Candidatus Falkowbacteria bacterium]